MSLLDVSLVALLAVPFVFFMGAALAYCMHAKAVVAGFRKRNTKLSLRCQQLVALRDKVANENTELEKLLDRQSHVSDPV